MRSLNEDQVLAVPFEGAACPTDNYMSQWHWNILEEHFLTETICPRASRSGKLGSTNSLVVEALSSL